MNGGGGVTVIIVEHPQKGQSPGICKALAEAGTGAYSYDRFGTACWSVYGMAVQINPVINSIMEGFMITNINFNAFVAPAAASGEVSSNSMGVAGYTGT